MAQGRVVLASDHGGYALKEALKAHLNARGTDVLDVGTHSKDSCDYPVFARAAAVAVAEGRAWRGVIIDGAGIGSSMVANKVPGVRCGMAFNAATARNAREHNDANVLTLGAGYLDVAAATEIVDIFLSTDCTVDRHRRRVAMIDALDGAGSERTMTTSSDPNTLVEKIIKVLTANPTLVQPVVAAGAPPTNICMTCNPQDKSCGCKPGLNNVCCGTCIAVAPERVRDLLGNRGFRVTSRLGVDTAPMSLASVIDHTLLKADATYDDIDKLCDEAIRCGFASVCVNPVHVKRCADRLRGQTPVACTVVGFPLGATPSAIKTLETRQALRDGAKEIDMVINIGALRSGDHRAVYEDIRRVAEAAHEGRAILKVIIETALLTDEEKVTACVLARKARADFVKTSTGFSTAGATEHDVTLMAQAVDFQLQVKASGGIRSPETAEKMIAAGATRLGASVGVKISGCDPNASAAGGY